ncbi:hypothetical protein D3C71_1323640 [compost metagenome]
MLLEPAIVVKRLVHHAERDDGVDQVVVPGDFEVRREDECDAVADGEDGHELGHIPKRCQEEHHAEQEQQMVVTRQHVPGPQFDVVEVASV